MTLPTESSPRNLENILLKVGYSKEEAYKFSHVTLPFELMEHQYDRIQCGLSWERFGLFDEPRTGKTIVMQVLAIIYRYYGYRSIVLMPPILFKQFIREFDKIQGHNLSIKVLDGAANTKSGLMVDWALGNKNPPDVLLTTREMFAGPKAAPKTKPDLNNELGLSPRVYKYHEYLRRVYSVLMWDECHIGLQDETSEAFRAAEAFTSFARDPRLILSTGTPLTNELKNAYPIIRLKTPTAYESRRVFDQSHVVIDMRTISVPPTPTNPRGLKKVPEIVGYIQQDILKQNLYQQARRVLRSEVFDLKVPNISIVPIELEASHYKLYQTAIKERLIECGSNLIDLRQAQTLRQFALRMITDLSLCQIDTPRGYKNAVMEAVTALFNTHNVMDNKIIVFANFTQSVEFFFAKFKAMKLNPAIIYGGNSADKNSAEADRFCEVPSCRVAVINPQAGGAGFTFGHVCQTTIFAEPVSVPGLFEQAAARTILKGQQEAVQIYLLQVLRTISPKAISDMLEKANEIQEILSDSNTIYDNLTIGVENPMISLADLKNELLPV